MSQQTIINALTEAGASMADELNLLLNMASFPDIEAKVGAWQAAFLLSQQAQEVNLCQCGKDAIECQNCGPVLQLCTGCGEGVTQADHFCQGIVNP